MQNENLARAFTMDTMQAHTPQAIITESGYEASVCVCVCVCVWELREKRGEMGLVH